MRGHEFLAVDTEALYRVLFLYNSLAGGHRDMSYTLFLFISPPLAFP